MRLTFKCDVCHEEVEDGTGFIHANFAAILARKGYDDVERAAAVADSRARIATMRDIADDLLTMPGRAPWEIHHRACDPDIDSSDYSIEIERCRTPEQLLEWTAHLMQKTWFAAAAWDCLITSALHSIEGEFDA